MSHNYTTPYTKLHTPKGPGKKYYDNKSQSESQSKGFLSRWFSNSRDDRRPTRCRFCDLDIPNFGHADHVKLCRKKIVFCQLCDHTMNIERFIDHINACSKSCYDSYYFLGERDYSVMCAIKYNRRYTHLMKSEIKFDNLISAAASRVFFHPTERDKNHRFEQYTLVKKRKRILLDLIDSLPDTLPDTTQKI